MMIRLLKPTFCFAVFGMSAFASTVPINAQADDEIAEISPATAGESESPKVPLNCLGTEPFWGLELSEDGFARWSGDVAPDESKTKKSRYKLQTSRNYPLIVAATFGAKRTDHAIIQSDPTCSDGMSDEEYPYSVSILWRGGLYSGCCLRAKRGEAQQ